jgi:hypothetical protein
MSEPSRASDQSYNTWSLMYLGSVWEVLILLLYKNSEIGANFNFLLKLNCRI